MEHRYYVAMLRKHRMARFVSVAAGLLAAGVGLSGCIPSSGGPKASLPQTPAASASASSAPASSTPLRSAAPSAHRQVDHVVIILEENKPPAQVIGNTHAPYLNALVDRYALATNYSAITHPSLPNYIALTGGTTAGITNDCNPPGGSCVAAVPSIADELESANRSWKMYAESMPAPCGALNAGAYAVKHNPFLYYPSISRDRKRCETHVVPFDRFPGDLSGASTLPDYAFISPNLCNDMHDCAVATGDAWLAREVPAILASPAFTQQNSLLVITWDEDSGGNGTNIVPTIFAGPAARTGQRSAVEYSHYSLLRTVESFWSLPPLASGDGSASVMTDMLR
jgi:phospholipase C